MVNRNLIAVLRNHSHGARMPDRYVFQPDIPALVDKYRGDISFLVLNCQNGADLWQLPHGVFDTQYPFFQFLRHHMLSGADIHRT